MELMKEGGEEVGTPSKSVSRRRRRREGRHLVAQSSGD